MTIDLEINNQVKVPFKVRALFKQAALVTAAKLKLKRGLSVSVAIVGSAAMKKLNLRYRHKDKATDVLSFEGVNELVLCLPQALKQARAEKHSLEMELTFLLVHGLLHLLGYEDETREGYRLMLELGQEITQKIVKI